MDFRILSSLLAASTCLALSLYILFQPRPTRTQKLVAYSNLSMMVWNLGDVTVVLAFAAQNYILAIFFDRLSYFGATFFVTFYVLAVSTYLSDWKGIYSKTIRLTRAVFLLMAFLMGVMVWTPLLVKEVSYPPFVEVPGELFSAFAVFWVGGILYGAACLFYALKSATGIKRDQLKYFSLALCMVAFAASIYFVTILDPAFPPVYYHFEIAYLGILFYAIIRHRLMDITVVYNKAVAYGLLLAVILGPTALAILISQRATIYSIPPLIALSLVFPCGLWVVLRNYRSPANITFGLYCLGICIWLLSMFMTYSTSDEGGAIFWQKFAYAGVVFIPAFLYHFCLSFLQDTGSKKLILVNYVISAGFLLLLPTNYLMDGVHHYFWGYYSKAGPAEPLLLLYFAIVTGLSLRKLYAAYKAKEAKEPREATRIKYIFWAFILGYVPATLDFVQDFGIEFYPTGYLFASLMALIIAYAVVKYQVMDISLVITRAKVLPYAQVLALIPIYFLILLLYQNPMGSPYVSAGIQVAIIVLLAGFVVNLRKRMEQAVGKTLFKKWYDAYETLAEFSRATVTILDLNALIEKIIATLSKVMGIAKVSLFLADKEKDTYVLKDSRGIDQQQVGLVTLKSVEVFPQYLQALNQPLLREDVEHNVVPLHGKDPKLILDTLAMMESELCLPFVNKGQLVGFLNLGQKASRGTYSQEDLRLLTSLADQAATALDNALLYEDLRRQKAFVRRLDRLRSLETLAAGFAHEVRNPLTSIKTFVQLVPERKDNPEFTGPFGKMVLADVARIERLISDIMDYARYMQPKFMEEDVNDIVAALLPFVQAKACCASITVDHRLAPDLPRVMVDRQQINQVLMNLFMNALDALGEEGGRLSVKTCRLTKPPAGDLWVQVEVADTGCGIAPADLDHVFDPFYTTKHARKEWKGTGLGLTIVHGIIQEHGGSVEVESKVGRGTTFFVNLPVKHDLRRPEGEPHEEASPGRR